MEIKKPKDFITDGVLAWGVCTGRFVFSDEKKIVYAVSDCPHIGGSDVFMYYQLSHEDYQKLMGMSRAHEIPVPPVPHEITDRCHREFLCGESAFSKRNAFSLEHADSGYTEDLQEISF